MIIMARAKHREYFPNDEIFPPFFCFKYSLYSATKRNSQYFDKYTKELLMLKIYRKRSIPKKMSSVSLGEQIFPFRDLLVMHIPRRCSDTKGQRFRFQKGQKICFCRYFLGNR